MIVLLCLQANVNKRRSYQAASPSLQKMRSPKVFKKFSPKKLETKRVGSPKKLSNISQPMPKMKNPLLNLALQNSMKKNISSNSDQSNERDANTSTDSTEAFLDFEKMVARPSFDFGAASAKLNAIKTKSNCSPKFKRKFPSIKEQDSPCRLKSRRSCPPKPAASLVDSKCLNRSLINFTESDALDELNTYKSDLDSPIKFSVTDNAINDVEPPFKCPRLIVTSASSVEDLEKDKKYQESSCQTENSPVKTFVTASTSTDDKDIILPAELLYISFNLLKKQNEIIRNRIMDDDMTDVVSIRFFKFIKFLLVFCCVKNI